eukprot:m.447298 g.447298  ORF g.447298 m.447298 type:complete len:124 (+) comp56878_c0_seq13:1151-1522(+)
MLPVEGVMESYVVESPTTHEITDFISFYLLPSTITKHPTHHMLYAAYSYYNVATSTELQFLMQDALTLAKSKHIDVFNALDIMENKLFLDQLNFGIGDGALHYYLYNYALNPEQPEAIGLVLM